MEAVAATKKEVKSQERQWAEEGRVFSTRFDRNLSILPSIIASSVNPFRLYYEKEQIGTIEKIDNKGFTASTWFLHKYVTARVNWSECAFLEPNK